jgi:hypothetical protein
VYHSSVIADLAQQRQRDYVREAQRDELIAEAEAYAAAQAKPGTNAAAGRPSRLRLALRRLFAAEGELAAS